LRHFIVIKRQKEKLAMDIVESGCPGHAFSIYVWIVKLPEVAIQIISSPPQRLKWMKTRNV
jgi:hypothetical protein